MFRVGGLGCVFGVIAVGLWCGSANAAFKVYPTIVDVQRNPGGAALGTIDVELRGEGGHRFRVLVEDIGQRPDGSQVYAPASGSRRSASSWVGVSPTTFAGGPGRTQPVQFQVAVPADAEPGDHLTSLTVQRLAGGCGEPTATAVQAVSVRLTIRVRGRLRPRAAITALEVPGVADGGPVSVATTVRNSGNVTLDFGGANRAGVTIRDGGEEKAALPFGGQLFPGQTREFVSRWEDPPLFGDFEAEASVRTGDGAVRREEGFWVVPWREIGALLLLVAAAVLFARAWRRRRY
jgi:hypothetical protein